MLSSAMLAAEEPLDADAYRNKVRFTKLIQINFKKLHFNLDLSPHFPFPDPQQIRHIFHDCVHDRTAAQAGIIWFCAPQRRLLSFRI